MTRKFPCRSPRRPVLSSCDTKFGKVEESGGPRSFKFKPSVHHRNLYIVSWPIVILFEYLSFGIHRLFYLFVSVLILIWSPVNAYCSNRQKRYLDQVQQKYKITPSIEVTESVTFSNNKMASSSGSSTMKGSPGLGDPMLVRQKQHHRKAFEYISKALRIDEENIPGNITYQLCIVFHILITMDVMNFNYGLTVQETETRRLSFIEKEL